jgi:hypothetical protein
VPAGERLAGWALTDAGEPVVATSSGLLLPGREPVAWQDVERASWAPPVLRVLVLPQGQAVVAGTGPSYEVSLQQPGDLPDVIRTRVTGSVAWSSHSRLSPSGGVRVVGRRKAGLEVLDWQLVFDAGTDPDDPVARGQAEALLLAARRTIG